MGAPCNGDAPGRCLLSVATYFSSTHFGGNDVCKTKSRIDLFCKQRDHLLSVNLLQRSIRHSAAVGQEWPQQAAVRTGFEIYYLGHVQRRVRPSCGFPVGPFTPVWSHSLVGHHCMMYLGHREAPSGRATRAQRVLGLLGVGVGVGHGNDNWVPSLEGAVRGWWVRYKDCGCSFTRRGSLAFFCIFHYQVQWGLWAQLNCYFIIVQSL